MQTQRTTLKSAVNAEPNAWRLPVDQLISVKNQEFNGPKGPEPTRYRDWDRKGRRVDFRRALELETNPR